MTTTNLSAFKGKGYIIPKYLIPDVQGIVDMNMNELGDEFILEEENKTFMICEIIDEKSLTKTEVLQYYGGIAPFVLIIKELKKPKPIFDEWSQILNRYDVKYGKFICML
jgi:hypothetical protein